MTAIDTATGLGPGIYRLSAEDYHADPVRGGSLSSSGARHLLDTCPALYRHRQLNGEAPKAHFDFGHAAHRVVLGIGAGIAVIDADSWRTKAAKEARDEARAEGLTPLLPRDFEIVEAMAKALRDDPVAAPFLAMPGEAEMTLIWEDERTGVMRRALLDWLPKRADNGWLCMWDYKGLASAQPVKLPKVMHDHGHHRQADWYRAGAVALGLAEPDTPFVFICQEKTAPYLVTVHQPDANAMRIAKAMNHQAIDLFKHCTDTDTWPGYATDVVLTSLPRWVELQEGYE